MSSANIRSGDSTSPQSQTDGSPKQAACLECRRSKIKCVRDKNATVCKKCRTVGVECVIPEYHIGRHKGVKNKRTGLEKAIHQVEQAIKRSKTNGVSFDADTELDLRQLIERSNSNSEEPAKDLTSARNKRTGSQLSIPAPALFAQGSNGNVINTDLQLTTGSENATDPSEKVDELALNNADNPLQLLAMASSLPVQSPENTINSSPAFNSSNTSAQATELQRFFGNLMPKLDNTPDLDPIELGLISIEEAEIMFKYFYDNLAHTRWGLDPRLHTTMFVRSRSAFLFTSVVAASATFMSNTAALAKRLSDHRDRLAQQIISKRYRSLEVVLALMLNIPWLSPAKHWADDETCTFLSMALKIALDLQLNKIVVPSTTIRAAGFLDRVSKADCIEATKALQLDGFSHVDPTSTCGRRLLRCRERIWLALFTLDRGVCLSRGRLFTVPTGPPIDSCDAWHISDIADQSDGSIISTCVLRRDLVPLIASVRDACDNSQLSTLSGSTTVKFLKDRIDRFFDQWHSLWSRQISQGDGNLPPYVGILVSHTKLSTYCSVINHPTASSDLKQFFRAAGLASALDVMRAAVKGEARLKSMPNNTAIMVSFAACFAMGLSTTNSGGQASLAPNARFLIEEVSRVLERIGTTPKHRDGASALFGRHIRQIMQSSFPNRVPQEANPPNLAITRTTLNENDQTTSQFIDTQVSILPNLEPYEFNMTDDQIIEAINNASASQELFQMDESLFLDWMDWPNAT